jgi:hypothetical protein
VAANARSAAASIAADTATGLPSSNAGGELKISVKRIDLVNVDGPLGDIFIIL